MIASKTQVIVLQASDGTYYIIPLGVVQQYRVPEELRDAVANAVTAESVVQGYGMPGATVGLFEVEDFSFDIEQTLNIGSQSSGAGAGKVTFNPFSITRKTDVASPKFFS